MKLFVHSHLSLIFLTFVQGIFVFGYYWFLGFQSLDHLFYVFSIQILTTCSFIAYRWIQDKKIYDWLLQNNSNEEFSVPHFGNSQFAEALSEKQTVQTQMLINKFQQVQTDLNERVTFINQWVHQMKTPLSVIHLMIQENDDLIFQNIRKELYRLEVGLQTVLYSSRLSMFEKDYTIEKVLLQNFISEIIKENKRLFIQYQITPLKLFPEQGIFVFSDKKWLQFAIGQIISNALKYSNQKSKLNFKIESFEEHIVLEIQDFGIGIPPEDLKRVFEKYFTGVNGRLNHESTGLGLYLVKEIMNKLQHEITLESNAGSGTIFKIYFTKFTLANIEHSNG
ncbi:sensor histidine kinase [Paenibacillus hexagrammi]|uniref:histidine kinase n=1 Tax=Paenibacillus hexagrammi TaxID=2908839 RepID=A0ABY3SL07_9BACL|nr:sensor histidine kinase [Paenibacillus sp. YPD9-1]UJF33766.1 sensor histidine kinase [Paenibacillus sp. YPD9-1]